MQRSFCFASLCEPVFTCSFHSVLLVHADRMCVYYFVFLHSHAGAYSFRIEVQKRKGTEYLDRVGQSNCNKLSLSRAGSGNPLFDFLELDKG